MNRRQFTTALSSTLIAPAWAASSTDGKPLRLVVPFAPGGATDITARAVGDQLSKELSQPVIVENKAGAGGSIGMQEVARSEPDGLTLGVATLSTHGVNPAVYKKLGYDPVASFAPVAELVKAPGVLIVNAGLGVRDMAAFLKLLKSQPGKLMYASPGNGTIGHMWAELFKRSTQTFMLHVPYRGAAPALNDVLAGQVHAYFDQVASALPHIQSGKVKALAVSWPTRLEVLPDVPTFAEVGLPNNNLPSWFGLVAPAGTPAAEVKRLHQAVGSALKAPGISERLAKLGLYPSPLRSPAEFGTQIRQEIERMQQVAQFAKIQLD
ncbi:tripartite tricarboxylate transporter substrate binding protein BugE [Schlegelella sp. S2-27]|uniref:Tripartite tricarboxylate transporter substrate binding protein BugE n=1 Tax=Caldimonas mangrovi TaxID=2944811 RepID=A0ABT0YSX4_9BURK|nr:tripartite tricarboxylate transporter substrate binding protein BugE [Caldimonas mangrovi]MCM5681847.1 tripartite tricarboxylate transporter substrate binding protein BugE [Caldimonas mangrovi]